MAFMDRALLGGVQRRSSPAIAPGRCLVVERVGRVATKLVPVLVAVAVFGAHILGHKWR